MKRGSTMFLRGVVFLLGAVVLTLCMLAVPAGLRQPGAEAFRPVLWGLYVTAVPFFIALHQTLKLLGYIDQNLAFSDFSVAALRHIKYCAVTIAVLFAAGLPYVYVAADKRDASAALMLGAVIMFASVVFAVFAAVLQKLLQDGLEIKSEHDLTV